MRTRSLPFLAELRPVPCHGVVERRTAALDLLQKGN